MNNLDYRKNINDKYNLKDITTCKNEINNIVNINANGKTSEIYKLESKTCGYCIIKKYKNNNLLKDKFEYEININNKIKELVDNNTCPNYMYPYYISKDVNKFYNNYFMLEYMDDTLTDFFNNFVKNKIIKSLFFQIMIGLLCFDKIIGLRYGDIHKGNFFYKKINSNIVFKYVINDNIYYVPTYGYLFVIGDFGRNRENNTDEHLKKRDYNKLFKLILNIIINNYFKKNNILDYNNLLTKFPDINQDIIKFITDEIKKNIINKKYKYEISIRYILLNNIEYLKNILKYDLLPFFKNSKKIIDEYILLNKFDYLQNILNDVILPIFNKIRKWKKVIKEYNGFDDIELFISKIFKKYKINKYDNGSYKIYNFIINF